jgi:hypothetical protein
MRSRDRLGPVVMRALQPAMPLVGFLRSTPADPFSADVAYTLEK